VGGVGGVQDLGALGPDGRGVAVVNVGGGVQAESPVAVVVVVPAEEFLAVRAGGLDRAKPGGERRPVLEGLELRFGVRVVVAHVRAGVGLGDAQVRQQQGDGLGGHRGAAVGVQAELPAGDALFRAGRGDELLG